MKNTTSDSTTQQFLDIYNITNDIVIMKDGSVSMLLTVDAMNFGLLAEEEQDAVMYAYAGLLNSLNYPIQVVISSHTKDVTKYLDLLKSQEEQTSNQLMRQRIKTYRQFVANLIKERNVLDKKFYVAIPASGLELGFISAKSFVPGQQGGFDIGTIETNVIVEKAHNLLEPRRDHLITQFARIGLYAKQLTTQEIIQLFYISYNPEAAEGQLIADSNNYTSPLVTASIEKDFMLNATPSSQGTNVGTGSSPTPATIDQTQEVVDQTPASTPPSPIPTPSIETPTADLPTANPFSQPPTSSIPVGSTPQDAGLDLPPQAMPPAPQLPTTPTPPAEMSSPIAPPTPMSPDFPISAPDPLVTTPLPATPTPPPITDAGVQAEINQVVDQFNVAPDVTIPTAPSESSNQSEPINVAEVPAVDSQIADQKIGQVSAQPPVVEKPASGMAQSTPPPIPEL
ncbi:MAG: hypothetical protein ABIJ03_02420 [Patescibacteria group bacterium]|nr:hypothetical protein [Patescibacteria group bacterium]